MPAPFRAFPTLGEIIAAAKQQGCQEGRIDRVVGPRGRAPGRYLIGTNAVIKILPNIADADRLAPNEIRNIVRVLNITGFDHYFIDDDTTEFIYVANVPDDEPPFSRN